MAKQPPVHVALPCLLPGQLLGQLQVQEPHAMLMNSAIPRAQSPFQVVMIMEYALVTLQSERSRLRCGALSVLKTCMLWNIGPDGSGSEPYLSLPCSFI